MKKRKRQDVVKNTLSLHRDGKVMLLDTLSIPSKTSNFWYLRRKTVVRFLKMILQTWVSVKCVNLPPTWWSTHRGRWILHVHIAHDSMLSSGYQRSLWICWASNSNLQVHGLPQHIERKTAVPTTIIFPTTHNTLYEDQETLMTGDSWSEQNRFSKLNIKKWRLSRL